MASGLPVICSLIRGNIDLIEDGRGGYLCDAGKVKDFVKSIRILISNADLRYKMGQNNMQTVKRFGIDKVKEMMTRIYEGT